MSDVKATEPPAAAERRVGEAIERISTGDLSSSSDLSMSATGDGERRLLLAIDGLTRRLRRVVGGLRRAAGSVELIAGEVLRATRGLSSSVLDEGASIEETSTSIAEINVSLRRVEENVIALSSLSQTTSTSALEMASSIDQVSVNADALSQFVEETATAIEQMTFSIRNVASNTEALSASAGEAARSTAVIDESTQRINSSAEATSELADEVMRSAQAGSAVVYETARSMQAIKEAIDRASETIGALGRRSEQVGEITHVIEEIAERTNLLALNAAILAAQAGGQGRGFRIVADEIKQLSERTAASTAEIAALIEGVRTDVYTAMERVASGEIAAERGVEQAYNAAALLDEISSNTVRASHKIRAIAEATGEQSEQTHKVREAAELVLERTQQIVEATAEQARTSQHIAERAVHMSELTEQVRRATQEQAQTSKHIAVAMEELTSVVEQIRSAVGEQSVGAEHVLRAIEVIKEVVSRNQASIATINGAVDGLGREAALLRREVEQFRLPEPRRGGHLRVTYLDSQITLDTARALSVSSMDVLDNIFDGLVESGEGSEILPALAERWEVSPDGRVYTFVLRRGVKFHNGRELVAEDVRYSFERILRDEEKAGAWLFTPIEGSDDFARGEADHVSGIEVLDDRVVQITLKRPLAFFLSTLCIDHAYIVPREEVERTDRNFALHPVGCGPFYLSAHEPNRRADLLRFEDYYRPDRPHVDRLTFEFQVPLEEAKQRLLSGELAYIKDPSPETLAQLESDPVWKGSILSSVQLYTGGVVFDCEYPPFDRRDVRQAVGHSIDRERFIREIHGEIGMAATGPIPPGLVGYDPEFYGLEYDPDRARALLARAGLSSGIKATFWRTHASISQQGAERICDDLAAVGIDVDVRTVDLAEYTRSRGRGLVPLRWGGWIADYPDADNFTFVLFHSENVGMFSTNYRSGEVDHLAERARAVMDREERELLYRRLTRVLVEDAPAVFVMHRRNHLVHRPDIEGLRLYHLTPVVRPEEIWMREGGWKMWEDGGSVGR